MSDTSLKLQALRLPNNPILYPNLPGLSGELGSDINGPSLIRVPDSIENPLGRYYLYFAHHSGKSIRWEYSKDLRDKMNGQFILQGHYR